MILPNDFGVYYSTGVNFHLNFHLNLNIISFCSFVQAHLEEASREHQERVAARVRAAPPLARSLFHLVFTLGAKSLTHAWLNSSDSQSVGCHLLVVSQGTEYGPQSMDQKTCCLSNVFVLSFFSKYFVVIKTTQWYFSDRMHNYWDI